MIHLHDKEYIVKSFCGKIKDNSEDDKNIF